MWRKLLFFAALYFLQGAALAYVVNFQKPYLVGRGLSKESIGLFTSALLLPFILKILLGYLSDRWAPGKMGPRKPYMILGLALFGGGYWLLSGVDPGQDFARFAVLTWIASLGLAWFDTCADAWAVDVAGENEESSIQAAMIAGKSLGLITMAGFFGFLGMRYGFQAIFQCLAYAAIVVLAIVTLVRHRPLRRNESLIGGKEDLLQGFFLAFAAFGIVYSIASFGTDGLLTLFLSEVHNHGAMSLGYFGMLRGAGALVGAVAFALVSRRLGLFKAGCAAVIALGLGCLLPALALETTVLGLAWGFAWGFQETAYVTLAMRLARGKWAATLFAAGMIFSNVGTAIGEALAAPLVSDFGYSSVFGAFALVAWASVMLIPKIHSGISGAKAN